MTKAAVITTHQMMMTHQASTKATIHSLEMMIMIVIVAAVIVAAAVAMAEAMTNSIVNFLQINNTFLLLNKI